jgi:hypothetical protein
VAELPATSQLVGEYNRLLDAIAPSHKVKNLASWFQSLRYQQLVFMRLLKLPSNFSTAESA